MKYIRYAIIMMVFMISGIHYCYATVTWKGTSEWNVNIFASPGIAGSNLNNICAAAISDWKSTGTNKVYTAAFRTIPGGAGSTEKFIYEFTWNGASWDIEIAELNLTSTSYDMFNAIKDMGFFNVRGTDTRLYFTTIAGSIYEYSTDTNKVWKVDTKIKEGTETYSLENFKVTDARGDGKMYLYGGNGNTFCEYSYDDTGGWQLKSSIDTSTSGKSEWITDISYGVWPDRGRKLYACIWNEETIYELTLQGDSWVKSSALNVNNEAADLGSPTLFVADCGRGTRLYTLNYNHNIVECNWNGRTWLIKNLSDDQSRVVSITYGRVSNDPTDPVCLYALVSKSGTTDLFSLEKADEIHEYTYRKDTRKWVRTCLIPLYEKSLLENDPTFSRSGFQIYHLYMVNARNESDKDSNGNTIDKYRRLYIVDSFGTLWECSVPPRKIRPPDPDDPYNPNNPNFIDPNDPNNPINSGGANAKIKPSILGGKQ